MNADPDGPPEHTRDVGATSENRANPLGTTAGIAGIVGILVFFSLTRGLGLLVAICAVLLGFVARSQARSRNLRTGMANVGIISGLLLGALYPLILTLESIWPV